MVQALPRKIISPLRLKWAALLFGPRRAFPLSRLLGIISLRVQMEILSVKPFQYAARDGLQERRRPATVVLFLKTTEPHGIADQQVIFGAR